MSHPSVPTPDAAADSQHRASGRGPSPDSETAATRPGAGPGKGYLGNRDVLTAGGAGPEAALRLDATGRHVARRGPPSPESTASELSKSSIPETSSAFSAHDDVSVIPSSQPAPSASGHHIFSSAPDSQESVITSSTDRVSTPITSDASGGFGRNERRDAGLHLHQLSAFAATQDKLAMPDYGPNSRKRMADGEVKAGSVSPVKGHSRNTSAVSIASTTSTIGDLSAELRTRLSYAMVKLNNGWQSHSIAEVESLASQAGSPTSSTSTAHRRQGSSASPRLPLSASATQVQFATNSGIMRRKSNSPPSLMSHEAPRLAPAAPIQSATTSAPRLKPRRKSNPRYTPTTLAHAHNASPRTPGEHSSVRPTHLRTQGGAGDHILYSPHQNVREQDAIETLLFMSSPNNSANLKHSFSPSGSPGPLSQPTGTGAHGRHALPSVSRRGLPAGRPLPPPKKVGFDRSPASVLPPESPMDLDSPHSVSRSPNRRKRMNGGMHASAHLRGALSLPSGLGAGSPRETLRDEDIERMLDRADAESSDDDEITLPRGSNGFSNGMRI